MEPRPLRRAPAPLAGDDLIILAVGPQQDRLKHAALARSNSASSSSASSSNWMRGWLGLGRIRAISISRTPPRDLRSPEPAAGALLRRAAPTGPCRGPCRRSCSCRHRQLRQPADHLAREADIGLGAGAFEVVDQAPAGRGSALPTGARCAARPSRTPPRRGRRGRRPRPPGERLLRRSNMVSATPRIDSSGLNASADPLDRLQQLAQPLERKELALQRHEQVARRDQRIDRQQAERRRAIDQANVPAARRRRARAPCRAGARDPRGRPSRSRRPTGRRSPASRSSRGTRVATAASTTDALPISTS